jgi:hypothetical protein
MERFLSLGEVANQSSEKFLAYPDYIVFKVSNNNTLPFIKQVRVQIYLLSAMGLYNAEGKIKKLPEAESL